MANSKLRLYYTTPSSNLWELLPHKLFCVDNIEGYLATKSYAVINDFQYLKPQLELSIVVDLSQTNAEMLAPSFKYVRVENSATTGKYYYYFVKNVIWRALSSVRFELVLDVLNTFKEGRDYNFKDNTRIIREHKDRFTTSGVVSCVVDIDYQIAETEGEFAVNDTVGIVQDGELLFEAVVLNVDAYSISLQVENMTEVQIEDLIDTSDILLIAKDNLNFITVNINDMNIIETEARRLFRKIDFVQENINPPLYNNPQQSALIQHEKSLLRQDWYLLYRNQNDPTDSLVNPVECYLLPKTDLEVNAGVITSGRLDATSLNNSYYYGLIVGDKGYTAMTNVSITLDNGYIISPSVSTNYARNVIIKRNDDNSMTITCVYGSLTDNATNIEGTWNCQYITFSSMPITLRYGATMPSGYAREIHDLLVGGAWLIGTQTLTNTTNPSYLNNVNDLDRTDPKNIKLIKLPYSPYNFTITSGQIDVRNNTNWDYVKLTQTNGVIYCLKLNKLNTDLTNTWKTSIASPLQNIVLGNVDDINPTITDLKNTLFESKLYHSEFYRPTYAYDSFQFVMQLEKIDLDYYINNETETAYLTIKFDMTKTINSKFMFTFVSYVADISNENYYNYMPIARNNEEVLYNVPYINYIRNGFNYDVKAKNLANASNLIGTGLSLAGVGISLALPSAPLKALGVATSLISMAMTTKNAIVSVMQNEDSINRKLNETKQQTSSVAGSDDVDLMSVYAENRLKYLVYTPNEIMKNMLYNLFFYAGYNSNRMGLPNHNTRVNFDYLEADVVLNNLGNMSNDCMEELINCFKNGVSYIHETNRNVNKWDFNQIYENWEVSIIGG